MDPKTRRRYARIGLFASLVAGALCFAGYSVGWISHEAMDVTTNVLSWAAISITMVDVLATTDVRVNEDSDE